MGTVMAETHPEEPIQAAVGGAWRSLIRRNASACPGGSDEPWRGVRPRRRVTVALVHRRMAQLGIRVDRLPAAELYTWPALRLARLLYRLGRKAERRGVGL